MSCGNKCTDCDCGQAMNNIIDTAQEAAKAVATWPEWKRGGSAASYCVDCGEGHLPGPCIECTNCNRDFYLATMHIDADKAYWCEACFRDMLAEDLTPSEEQMEFGWLVEK